MKRVCLLGAVLILVGLSGCSSKPGKDGAATDGDTATPKTIRVDGSSTVAPVTELAAEEFQKANPNIRIPIITSGTGGGFKKFVRNEIDFSNASRPILKAELDLARENGVAFVELPICFDAITVVVNRDNDWASELTTAELKAIWSKEAQGQATRWSDVRQGWPAEKIELFGPGRDSGTFDYFTEAINGKAGDSRTDYTASEDDNRLVRGVAGNKFSLGYFGFAYFAAHKDKLSAVKIKGPGAKVAVEPGAAGIRDGSYTPLSRPLFVYVNKKSAERPEVARFVTFLLEQAPSLTARKKYVPLTPQAYALIAKRFEQRRTGSAFDGTPAVGLSMDAILNRELR